MNEQEREWRLSLKVGDTVDVFKRDVKYQVQMWTKGEIVSTSGY